MTTTQATEHPVWRNLAGVFGLLVAMTIGTVILFVLFGWLLTESRSYTERNQPIDGEQGLAVEVDLLRH